MAKPGEGGARSATPVKKAVPRPAAAPRRAAPAAAGMAGMAGANGAFDAQLQRLIAAAPGRITISSGMRTRAQQQKLYDAYLAGTGNLAAKPGTSNHELGNAYDLKFDSSATQRWAAANAARYGLSFPIKSEAWHVEPLKLPKGAQVGGGEGAGSPGGVAAPKESILGPDGKIDFNKAIGVYGSVAALAASVPDIARVIKQAIDLGIDPGTQAGQQRFQAMLENTAWWKKTSDSQRANEISKKTNPGQYRQTRQQTIDYMKNVATELGVEEGDQRLFIIAERAMSLGWSKDEMKRYLAADIKIVGGVAGGKPGMAAVTVDQLKEQASQYLVPMSDATLQTWTQQVLKGQVPIEAFQSYLKEQAKSLFPGLKTAIDSGVTVAQYVSPYRELAAQTLEINPNEINFLDPKWSSALFQQGKDGSRTSMSLADWQLSLRKRPEFAKTRGAIDQAANFATSLATNFGKLAS